MYHPRGVGSFPQNGNHAQGRVGQPDKATMLYNELEEGFHHDHK
jgi:hypothetical protein